MSSEAAYSFSRELVPSSGIDLSVMARFTSPVDTNLILARGNVLQIYLIVQETNTISSSISKNTTSEDVVDTDLALPQFESIDSVQPPFGARLELLTEFKLNGIVTSIGVIRTQTSVGLLGMDSLLLSFRDAKMSLVEFSMGYQTLVTVSLHHYEKDDIASSSQKRKGLSVSNDQTKIIEKKPKGYSKRTAEDMNMDDLDDEDPSSHLSQVKRGKIHLSGDKPPPVVRVDPLSRCALLWYYGEKLALLPFKSEELKTGGGSRLSKRQSEAFGPVDPTTANALPFLPSFTAWFTDLDPSIRNVIDCCFLYGFFEPTLAVLYQNRQTCTGRTGQLKDTVSLIVLSLDMDQKKYPVLFRVDGLPYNTTHMIPMPQPLGGVLIFSHNAVIHTDQTHAPGLACIVNQYFDMELELKPAWQENVAPEYIPPQLKRIPSVYSAPGRYTDYKELGLSLDGSLAVVLNPDTVLLILRSGQAVQIDLVGDENAGRGWKRRKAGVKKFVVKSLGFCLVPPSDVALITDDRGSFCPRDIVTAPNEYASGSGQNQIPVQRRQGSERGGLFQGPGGSMLWFGYFFVASRAADGMLVQFIHMEEGVAVKPVTQGADSETGQSAVDESSSSDVNMDSTTVNTTGEKNDNAEADSLYGDDDLDSLYGDSAPKTKTPATRIARPSYSSHSRAAAAALDDDFEMDLYGDTGANVNQDGNSSVMPWMFCLQDRVLVSGPSRDFSVGVPVVGNPAFPYATVTGLPASQNQLLEVVACGGEHPYGALAVQSESIRPVILSSFDLPGITDLWTVSASASTPVHHQQSLSGGFGYEDLEKETLGPKHHDYVILSMSNRTMILKTGEELEEFTGDFYTKGPTLAVGVVGSTHPSASGHKVRIVQVTQESILVLDAQGKKVSSKSLARKGGVESTDAIRWVSISDPYILLLTRSGDIRICSVDVTNGSLSTVGNLEDRHVTSCCLFSDPAGSLKTLEELEPTNNNGNRSHAKTNDAQHSHSSKNGNSVLHSKNDLDTVNEFNVSQIAFGSNQSIASKQWLFTVDQNGDLSIFSIPSVQEYFYTSKFSLAPSVAFDSLKPKTSSRPLSSLGDTLSKRSKCIELLVVRLGRSDERQVPYALARSESNEVFVYKIVPYTVKPEDPVPQDATLRGEVPLIGDQERLGIRLIRQQLDGLLLSPDVIQSLDDSTATARKAAASTDEALPVKRHLVPFESIGSNEGGYYSGVAVLGSRPCVILCSTGSKATPATDFPIIDESMAKSHIFPCQPLCGSNYLRVHPFTIDGAIYALGPFHNDSIQYGFMYVNSSNSLRVANLPSQFNYDNRWPICKAILPRKPEKLTYHYASETYVLATSQRTPFLIEKAKHASCVAAGVITEADELPEQERKIIGIGPSLPLRPGMYLPDLNEFQLELVSPVTWETVDVVKLQEAEQVLCIESLELSSSETQSGRKLFVAIGTAFFRGEDLSCRGRLLLYEIIDVVPEPDNPQTNHKFKFTTMIEEKQPISAICAVNGYLLASIGSKLIMYEIEDKELNGVAFLDVNLYTTSLRSVKNLILVTDICKSLWFVVFQEEPPKMTVLGRDLLPLKLTCGEFMIDDGNLMMVAADLEKNLHVLTYSPYHMQSEAGLRLVRNGEMHLGQVFWKLLRLRLRAQDVQQDRRLQELGAEHDVEEDEAASAENKIQKFGVVAVTEDGGLSVVTPVPEKVYKRLYALYTRMVTQIPPQAGLNPRGFRSLQLPVKPLNVAGALRGPAGPRGVLDGDYLATYLNLSLAQQYELAQAIGSTEVRILNDLLQFSSEFAYF